MKFYLHFFTRHLLIILFLTSCSTAPIIKKSGFHNPKLTIYSIKTSHGFEIYANNDEYCPVSLSLDFELKNMMSSMGNNRTFVVPSKTKQFFLTRLTRQWRGKYKFRYKSKYNYGIEALNNYNKKIVYDLPFEKNNTFKVSQGYNGNRTHQDINALDFQMKTGTNVLAAREGIVIRAIDNNDKSCPEKRCSKYGNFITVYHKDGTFAEYVHLQKDGALVKEGDYIKRGQIIARSGNTGWSSGPHLHFSVFLQKLTQRIRIKTKFRFGKNKIGYLIENRTYSRHY